MISERIYAALLLIYPRSFRQQYGPAMVDTFRDLRRMGLWTGVRFWVFVLADTCHGAWLQHLDVWTSVSRRVALRWILACVTAAVMCEALGSGITWAVGYFYHPYLEGMTLVPWIYGAVLGIGIGAVQSVMLGPPRNRAGLILISGAAAAVGVELASAVAVLTGPVGYGALVGASVAAGQWFVLRAHIERPGLLVLMSAATLALTAVAGSIALNRALAGMEPLRQAVVLHDPHQSVNGVLRGLYAPMNFAEGVTGFVAMSITGLIVGGITAKRASSLVTGAT